MIKNVKIVIIYVLKLKFYQYFVFTKKILQRFVSFCISLIFTCCLFVEKELVIIEIFLLDFSWVKMRDKMAISAYIREESKKRPIYKTSDQS